MAEVETFRRLVLRAGVKLLAAACRWLRGAVSQGLVSAQWIWDLSLKKHCASPRCLPRFLSRFSLQRAYSCGEKM